MQLRLSRMPAQAAGGSLADRRDTAVAAAVLSALPVRIYVCTL